MKYELYKDVSNFSTRIVCKRTTRKGKKSFVKDLESFNKIVEKFIKKDYKVVIKENNLYLFGEKDYFLLKYYREIINSSCLKTLKDSILTKVAEIDLMPKQEEKQVKPTRFESLLNKVVNAMPKIAMASAAVAACGVSLVAMLNHGDIEITNEQPENPFPTIRVTEPVATLEPASPVVTDFIEDTPNLPEAQSEQDIVGDSNNQTITLNNGYSINNDTNAQTLSIDNSYNINNDVIVSNSRNEISEEASFEEKSFVVRQRDYLTKAMLDELLIKMCNGTMPDVNFASSEEALDYLYNNTDRTYPEKMLIVMVREGLTYNELDDICAGVMAEGGYQEYDECYRVACVGYNRYRSKTFVRYYGPGLDDQFFAPWQFTGVRSALANSFKGDMEAPGYRAALDAFYSRKMTVIFQGFLASFCTVPEDWVQFSPIGNKYGYPQDPEDVLKLDYEITYEDEIEEDLEKISEENNVRTRSYEYIQYE